MAVTITVDPESSKNPSMASRQARGVKIALGSYTMPTLYVSGGITCNFASIGLNNVYFASFSEPEFHTYFSSDMLAFYIATATNTSHYTELASDTAITGTGGFFCAIGY